MYQLIRRILFFMDAEKAHYFAMNTLQSICNVSVFRRFVTWLFNPGRNLHIQLWGLKFRNPVGLAAGFDKNALYLRELQALGFGYVEIGTVTPFPQEGNDKPRLFRLPEDKALINRMGFNNDGVDIVTERLKHWRKENETNKNRILIGGNIGKNKITPNEMAYMDYDVCFRKLFDYVDYFVVNVSSPNTPGLRELQEKESLRLILTNLQKINATKDSPKPILLKIAPDLTEPQLDDVIALAKEIDLDGLVVANTSLDRTTLSDPGILRCDKIGAGGLSGVPVGKRAKELVYYVGRNTENKIPIIASGGINNAEDTKKNLIGGASMVQVWTAFIYEGPGIVKKICKGLKN